MHDNFFQALVPRGNVLDVEHRQGDGERVVQPVVPVGPVSGTSTVVERVTVADLTGELQAPGAAPGADLDRR